MNFLKKIDIRIYAAFLSLALSWIILHRHQPINPDGILYIATATAYLKTGFAAAANVYKWPIYPILIAWISTLSHLTLIRSAFLINTLFAAIITVAYLSILKELGASRAVQIAGTFIILAYPQLNDYRDYVIRDFGYWSFALISLWQLLRYSKTWQWRHAISWPIAMMIAGLFRIEGLLLLALLPCTLLFLRHIPWRTLVIALIKAYCMCAISLFVIWYIFHLSQIVDINTPQIAVQNVQNDPGRLYELAIQIKDGWQYALTALQQGINNSGPILSPYSRHYASLFFLTGSAAIFIAQILSSLTLLCTLLCLHTWLKKLMVIEQYQKIILYFFIAINFFILLAFFSQQLFLSGRYVILLCLALLIFAPYSLNYIYTAWRQKHPSFLGKSWLFPLVVFLLLAMLISSSVVRFGPSKAYVKEAGLWLQNNAAPTATIYSNDKQVLFYANHWDKIDFNNRDENIQLIPQLTDKKSWQNFQYLALQISHNDIDQEAKIIALIGKPPIQTFHNSRGDKILIFKP